MSSNNKDLFEKGLGNRREVVGDVYVDKSLQNGSSEFAFPNQQLVTEWCWGNIWSRPGLKREQRSLLNIGMLIALKSWPELGVHVRGAINNGVTEVEIREAILQASIYCGVPAGIEATKVAEKTLMTWRRKASILGNWQGSLVISMESNRPRQKVLRSGWAGMDMLEG